MLPLPALSLRAYLVGGAIAASLALACIQTIRLQGSRADLAHATAKHAAEREAAALELARATQAARARETAIRTTIDEVTRHAQDAIDTARADADRATAASRGLRHAAAAAAQRACPARADTAAATPGATASSAADVLADVLGGVAEAGAAMAAEAGRRGIAGRACEQSYDAVRAQIQAP